MNVDLFSGQLIKERPRRIKSRIMAGGSNKKEDGNKYDFFPTPEGAVKEIIERELKPDIPSFLPILEPACGEGHIVKVLEGYGYKKVEYSDIRQTEFLTERVAKKENFLLRGVEERASVIITNPPFSFTNEFILKAKEIAAKKIILLLKLNSLAGQDRYRELWSDYANQEFPLTTVYVFAYRLDFGEEARPPFELAWFVWERGKKVEEPKIRWIY